MADITGEKLHIQEHGDSPKPSADSQTSASTSPTLDPKKEKALVWKLDCHVLPMITILYMLSFVDRINIGNARIQGLEKDLGMAGSDYNIALFVFFIPYILFEVPSNVLLKRLKPSTWLSLIMFGWGKI
jgi:hypothetical protein